MKLFRYLSIKQAWMFSIFYFLTCNIPCLLNRIFIYKSKSSILFLELTKDSIAVMIFTYLLFVGLSLNRILLIVGSFFLFMSGAAFAYHLQLSKIQPSAKLITAIIHFEVNEAIELIDIKLFIWLTLAAYIWFLLVKKYSFTANTKLDKLISIICLCAVVFSINTLQYKVFKQYFPSQYLIEINNYLTERFKKTGTKLDISELNYLDKSAQDLDVVLIIGESARFDRFSINGYQKTTSPKLESTESLQKFKSRTCDTVTHISVPCIITRDFMQEKIAGDETSFLSLFKKLGFTTYWLGAQRIHQFMSSNANNFYDEVDFFMILPGGSALYRIERKDHGLLPFLQTALNKKKRNMIVLHTAGSHWDYSERYTKEFEKFKPVCELARKDYSSCANQEISNMYDNSILYTDHFIASVIDKLRDRNAILFYTSDHGESLGENGVFGHAGDKIEEQMNVPFFVWTSEKFQSANPELYKNLSKNNNKEINYKFLFHSILDCSNIKGDIIDQNFSLCK